jgi:Fuc2NAc and GlcNAc transferase
VDGPGVGYQLMSVYVWIVCLVALTVAMTAGICILVRKVGIIDIPNERSSHSSPVPRGGGVAIVAGVLAGLVLSHDGFSLERWHLAGVMLPAISVALVGLVDDKWGLAVLPRLGVQGAAVLLVVAMFLAGIAGQSGLIGAWLWLYCAGIVIGLLWLINLYNFMDGIDGIASLQAVFVAGTLGVLSIAGDPGSFSGTLGLSVAACAAGFLTFNWPPARIFMGDTGSGFLGFIIGAVALAGISEHLVSPFVPLILMAAFISDATVTLLRRMLRGERWHQAHRAHAYQHLAVRFRQHRKVLICLAGVNLVWLLPLALLAQGFPRWGGALCGLAYVPLVVSAMRLGAGIRS